MTLDDSEIRKRVKNIAIDIEKIKSSSGLNYIDATVEVCERYNIEIEQMKKVLPKTIKEKIEADALELNLLKYKVGKLV